MNSLHSHNYNFGDTAEWSASPKGPLSIVRYDNSTTGNQDFGYFAGGNPGSASIVLRVNYSNDTATASPKGPLAHPNVSFVDGL